MNSKKNRYLAQAALIAALYTALTYISGAFGMSYLGIQFRASEALTIMPVFTNAAIPGLLIGCILGNIGSPLALDIIFGSIATLIASFITRKLRYKRIKDFPLLSFLSPIIVNSVIVGAEIAFLADSGFSVGLFAVSALQVAAGEAAVLVVLGIPLFNAAKKLKIYSDYN